MKEPVQKLSRRRRATSAAAAVQAYLLTAMRANADPGLRDLSAAPTTWVVGRGPSRWIPEKPMVFRSRAQFV